MHPYLMEHMARDRRDALLATARAARRAPSGGRRRRHTVRSRAGWALVELGLRLAAHQAAPESAGGLR